MVDIDLTVLGVGAGATAVYHNECSSSFVISQAGKPLLLLDAGFGAAAACLSQVGCIPEHIYISHNHTDHSGELPVILAVERQKGRRLHIYAEHEVMERIKEHRLHELKATGLALEAFGLFVGVQGQEKVAVTGQLSIMPVQARHAERCFGLLVFYQEQPILGWSADSGFYQQLYRQLAVSPLVLLDARAKATTEHAGFQEVTAAAGTIFSTSRIVVYGYGCLQEKPGEKEWIQDAKQGPKLESLPEAAYPGQVLMLSSSSPPSSSRLANACGGVFAVPGQGS